MKKMLFIVNPKAGRTTLKNSLVDVIDKFCKADIAVRVYLTQEADDAARIAREEGGEYDVVVCAGGDGTLNNTVTGIMEGGLDVPIGYIPCGSTNDFAKSLEISDTASEAADIIVKNSSFAIDIGQFNKKYFVYVAAFGVFSDVSYSTPQSMKNILGHAAYLLQGIKSLVNIPSYHIEVEYDGTKVEGDYIYGMVSNSTSVGGIKSIVKHGVEFDDGLFEGLLIEKIQNPADLQRIVNSLLLGNTNEKNMVAFKASHIVFKSWEKLPWTLDGEYGGTTETANINVLNKSINLLVDNEEIGKLEA